MVIPITTLDLPELAVYTRLTQAQLRSRRDPDNALFIAESAVVIGHALDAGVEPVSLLMTWRQLKNQGQALLARCGDVPVYVGQEDLLSQLTGYPLTRGVLCAMRRGAPRQAEAVCAPARRVAVLEDLVDPTNVGAVFRNAAALGMDGLLLSPSCCDPLSRRSVRVSMGTVFQLPWAYLPAWPQGGLALLKSLGFYTVALALRASAIPIDDPSLLKKEKLALLLGNEGKGLSAAAIGGCDAAAIIPMSHGVDSLNVSAAGAVAFWTLAGRS